jgi:hypothetical protein
MVNQSSLKKIMKIFYIIKETYTYAKPSHARSALVMLATTRPYASIIGKIPQMAIDIKMERNALILMLAMCYYFLKKSLPTCSQLSPQRFWNASGQQDKQQLD